MKKALVLGGAGFIGAALVQKLNELGFDVTAVDRYWVMKPAGVKCVTGDVFDTSCLNDVMPNQDVVFHLVSTTVPASSNKSPVFDCETNVVGALRVLDAMVKHDVVKIVFASSGGTVYGVPDVIPICEDAPNFPISAYGVGKVSIERYIKLYSNLHHIQGVVLRLSNPYGPGQIPEKGQGVIATFIKRALRGETIEIWGDGSVVRDFIYIDDLIDAFIATKVITEQFSILNIGMGNGHSLLEIISTIEETGGIKVMTSFQSARPCDVPVIVLNVSRAKKIMNWEFDTDLDNGIIKTMNHLKSWG